MHYPWSATPLNGVFFVPTLKLEETKQDGLSAAIHYGMIGKAEVGFMGGKLGVRFSRVR